MLSSVSSSPIAIPDDLYQTLFDSIMKGTLRATVNAITEYKLSSYLTKNHYTPYQIDLTIKAFRVFSKFIETGSIGSSLTQPVAEHFLSQWFCKSKAVAASNAASIVVDACIGQSTIIIGTLKTGFKMSGQYVFQKALPTLKKAPTLFRHCGAPESIDDERIEIVIHNKKNDDSIEQQEQIEQSLSELKIVCL